ncbi:MATE family efflux transporter [Aestuariispira insulae]|uniref:MATE family multidrug resistance protein n=1 Tax=Aestuariispira insulae TaxID=1461337 RepID=A0A3D9HB35_9PROT|nr:MATE family efflux transporter [Aestuariispira insulae]RED46216.1 MATE family multidrug resistance protein [Aestuariispira insulae]
MSLPSYKLQTSRQRVARHVAELMRLAMPVIVSRAGLLLLAAADMVMLGRLGAQDVAVYTLGTSPFVVLLVIGIGLMFGTMVSTSHAHGEGKLAEVGPVWKRSLPYALLIGLVMLGLSQFGDAYFEATRPAEDLRAGSARIMALQGIGLLPSILFVTTSFFLEGLGRPYPVLVTIGLANLVNIALNAVLIYGLFGTDALGAEGAALATVTARSFMALTLIGYVWFLPDREALGIRLKLPRSWWRDSRTQRHYGYAAGLSYGFETASFAVMSVYAGWLGADAAAVYGICINLMGMLFMTALGFATATAVRVGIAHGRRDHRDRALAGWTGLAATTVLMSLYAFSFWFWPEMVIGVYLDDASLIALSVPILSILGLIMYADGGQIVMAQSLRAATDTWIPTMLNFTSYMAIMIPCGYLFTQILPHGVFGLFEAIAVGSVVSVSILTGRWIWLCRQDHTHFGS